MRTTARLLPLLFLAACGDPTGWQRGLRGEWYLTATAGAECRMIARVNLTSADGQEGTADVGFSRQGPDGALEWGGSGFHVRVDYPRVYVSEYELRAVAHTDDAMRGTWSCDGTNGTWEMDRED